MLFVRVVMQNIGLLFTNKGIQSEEGEMIMAFLSFFILRESERLW